MNRRDLLKAASAAALMGLAPGRSWARLAGESDADFNARMAWWRAARFGMFIHWGVYSVPAGVWKGVEVPSVGEWIMKTARIPVNEYEKLAPEFNPVAFDADEWVRVAREAGMKYMVITAKHHDGFCMFKTAHTPWNIMDATPFGRDVIGELSAACQKGGVRFGFYYSILDWHKMGTANGDDRFDDLPAYVTYMKAQLKELLENYGEISQIFFDGEWIPQWTPEHGHDLESYVRSIQPAVVVNDRVGKRSPLTSMSWLTHVVGKPEVGDYTTPEQFVPSRPPAADWETCMTMNDTWGFKKNDHDWKSAGELTRKLIDIAAKGGNFLLNVGPDALGNIPAPSVDRLAEVGKWMESNGESIHGTTAGPVRKPVSTVRAGKTYLHVFDWPESGKLVVRGLTEKPARAYLLADPGRDLAVDEGLSGVTLTLPEARPEGPSVTVVLEK